MQALFKTCKRISESNLFHTFIIATILLAGIVVGIETYEPTSKTVKEYIGVLHWIDNLILYIFTFEVIVKILAEGNKPGAYFKDAWNIFDFLIVAICYAAFLLPSLDAGFIAVLRLVRILRVFKLVTALPKLQMLVGAMLKSIPSMMYVGILLGLLFYIYSAMGVFVFGQNDPVHFGTLHQSMLTLFRIVTLEGWTEIMYINMHGCDNSMWGYGFEEGCVNPAGNPILSVVFFVSFVLIGTMIVLNLFIGVIMNAMDEVREEEEERIAIEAGKLAKADVDASAHIDLIAARIADLQKELTALKGKL